MENREFFNSEAEEQRNRWLYADSEVEEKSRILPAPPFIVQIVNASGSTSISDVDIGDSFTNRTASNFGQNNEITMSSGIVGVSYRNFLASSEFAPFTVGATMIISSTSGQLNIPASITHRNANGDRKDFIIAPTQDPYQQQTDRVIDFTEYEFDGMTRIRFSSVLPSAQILVRIYPKTLFDAFKMLNGKNPNEEFGKPNLTMI